MSKWQYVLIERDDDDEEIIQGIDVTEEIICLYTRIEYLEASNAGFKALVLENILNPVIH